MTAASFAEDAPVGGNEGELAREELGDGASSIAAGESEKSADEAPPHRSALVQVEKQRLRRWFG